VFYTLDISDLTDKSISSDTKSFLSCGSA